ncbi:Flagellar biosynthesis protein FliS [hydrothermal vent metagenome]|uniref:Flagellar biosynthesis protein FliS n=1 Tax=hydrothermal vent metagenome TaxID=652676 RepID=A0A3B0YBL6_9ZZZZ
MSFSNARAALQQYKKINVNSQVEGASPHRLIQMLMEGALQKMYAARPLMEDGQLGPKAEQITWAISIIDGLRISLDKNVGGDIAQNLEDLYDYMVRRLVQANLTNDVTMVEEVIDLLKQIKEAWDAIASTPRPEQPAA